MNRDTSSHTAAVGIRVAARMRALGIADATVLIAKLHSITFFKPNLSLSMKIKVR